MGSDIGGSFGGNIRTDQLFKTLAFWWSEYKPKIENLQLKPEVSSDSYQNVSSYRKKHPASNLNYGFDYFLSENLSFSGYYMHENSLGFNISLSANPLKDHNPSFLEKSPEPYYSIPLDYNEEDDDFWTK